MRKLTRFLRSLLFLLLLALGTGVLTLLTSDEISGRAIVLDGDSIRIDLQEIRLVGIDAPEFRQECSSRTGGDMIACGRNARNHLREMLRGREVLCSGYETDKYNRLLANCSIGETDVNAMMVLSGHAVSFGDYEHEERIAREAGRGLWSGEFEMPRDWRRNEREKHKSGWFSKLFSW